MVLKFFRVNPYFEPLDFILVVVVGLSNPVFATIANFQWFSKAPSPLNGMVWGNHWVQWFFNGFGVRQPLVSMVFNGYPPLVKQWNGYIPSLKSTQNTNTAPHRFFIQEDQEDEASVAIKFFYCSFTQ